MPHAQLLDLDLAGAAAALESGGLDPVALTETYLARIAETEPSLNAYVTVDADGARAAAALARREIAAGRYRGPLHGIPVGVKDLFDTAGLRTTYGSGRYAAHVPTTDAVTVARLRSAGAVILGKQATHEFAWGGRTDGRHFGPTHNPHDVARIPGGSSGGGAASVVARSSLLAIGSDTAGSVRIPAALCGCVGYKPAHGWIDLAGVFPLEPGLDTVGVIARTVRDAALAAGALGDAGVEGLGGGAGGDGAARAFGGGGLGAGADARPLTVGVVTGELANVLDAPVAAGVARAVEALRRAGATIVDVPLRHVEDRIWAVFALVRAHAAGVHGDAFRAEPESYGADLAALLSMPPVTEAELSEARGVLRVAIDETRAALAEVDVLLSATEPVLAPPIGSVTVPLGGEMRPVENVLTRLTSLANATGWPALTVPAPGGPVLGDSVPGGAPAGETALPVGVQLQCVPAAVAGMLRAGDIVMGG